MGKIKGMPQLMQSNGVEIIPRIPAGIPGIIRNCGAPTVCIPIPVWFHCEYRSFTKIGQIPANVLPFILRGVNLLGVDSVELPLARKIEIWEKLAGPWQLKNLSDLAEPLGLDDLDGAIDRILEGRMVGRGVVDLSI